jgi:hypothetical protein
MSNSAPNGRFSRLVSTGNTVSRELPRSSVGAGYRCGVPACQTLKSPEKRFFPRGLWTGSGARERTLPKPTYRYRFGEPYIRQTFASAPTSAEIRPGLPKAQRARAKGLTSYNRLILKEIVTKNKTHWKRGASCSVYGLFYSRSSAIWRRSPRSRLVITMPSARL